MDIALHSGPIARLAADLLAVPVFENGLRASWSFAAIDEATGGALARAAADEEFTGGAEKTLTVHTGGRVAARRVLVVGLGNAERFSPPDARLLTAAAARAARGCAAKVVAVAVPEVAKSAADRTWEALGAGWELGAYRYDVHKEAAQAFPVAALHWASPPRRPGGGNARGNAGAARAALERGGAVGRAVNRARDLVNGPPNEVTPTFLADAARQIARGAEGLEVRVLTRRECERRRMGLYLAVARGAAEEPRFIHMTYTPPGRQRPKRTVGLVGKGVTFDSGGLSLKTGKQMEDMKTDMAGGAAVICAMDAIARLRPPVKVHAVCAATENMPSGAAYRPGDIFRGASGRSVEVLNTDAEGRLTLADAIHFVTKQGVDEIVELSTLTGACVVALGSYTAGLLSEDDALAARVLSAARDAGEDFWRLPLVPRLADDLKSEFADCKNIGGGWGGAITAGHFLTPFAGTTPFAHCDIAGPSSAEKPWGVHGKGGTGVGVMTLVEYVTRTCLG